MRTGGTIAWLRHALWGLGGICPNSSPPIECGMEPFPSRLCPLLRAPARSDVSETARGTRANCGDGVRNAVCCYLTPPSTCSSLASFLPHVLPRSTLQFLAIIAFAEPINYKSECTLTAANGGGYSKTPIHLPLRGLPVRMAVPPHIVGLPPGPTKKKLESLACLQSFCEVPYELLPWIRASA